MGLFSGTQEDYYTGSEFGGYQFVSIDDLINNFIIAYVGEDKIISKIKRTDVAFHAHRALQDRGSAIVNHGITSRLRELREDELERRCWY